MSSTSSTSTSSTSSSRPLETVAVAGASLGGLLAAAALAPHARRVVVVDRDPLPEEPAARSGTPQVLHAHGLLASGRLSMKALLPGFTEEMVRLGALSEGDMGSNGRWWVGGGLLADCAIGVTGVAASRPLIEATVRRMVRRLPNVAVEPRVDVLGLVAAGKRVSGLRVGDDAGHERTIEADLVVDATGRSGRAGRWWERLGLTPPVEERVSVGVRYATTHVAHHEGDLSGRSVAVSAATPEVPRGGVAIRQEDGTWVVMLFGYCEEQPALDPDGFRAYARTIVSPDVAALLEGRPLLEPPRPYRFPDCRRRRFEKVEVPLGYAALGDAICSFDPTFGQGMSVAALEAVALGEAAAHGPERVRAAYHREAAEIVDRAWTIVVGADLLIEGTEGTPPPGHRVISRYVRRAQRVAHRDPTVSRAVMRVTNLLAAPPSLMAPSVAWRVLQPGAAPRTSQADAPRRQAAAAVARLERVGGDGGDRRVRR
ncbi:NAD(P)/FAD-dependent oxidoreductase [Trujillonella humicola]|uniref:NAD(P)/FAD-dependent oxidoreductase n=1 Tax=Trujillonella humicola TaxID=3383699 RepID=UPI003906B67C